MSAMTYGNPKGYARKLGKSSNVSVWGSPGGNIRSLVNSPKPRLPKRGIGPKTRSK